MAKKYYVVWQGRKTGIFGDWNTCKQQIDSFSGAKYKSFKTKAEAEAAFKGVSTPNKRTSAPVKSTATKTYTEKEVNHILQRKKVVMKIEH